jgi:hypothetical protein
MELELLAQLVKNSKSQSLSYVAQGTVHCTASQLSCMYMYVHGRLLSWPGSGRPIGSAHDDFAFWSVPADLQLTSGCGRGISTP